MELRYSMTNDSVTVFADGEAKTVRRSNPNFSILRRALLERRWEDAKRCMSVDHALKDWSYGLFSVSDDGSSLLYNGEKTPEVFSDRAIALLSEDVDVTAMLHFHRRLVKNPSKNSVNQLYEFLRHTGIPLEPNGTFLAYKSVRSDFLDHFSGTVDYRPFGADTTRRVKYPRDNMSDDPNKPCHRGLHVGAMDYVGSFGFGEGKVILVCRVLPENVVCVPNDYSYKKMRVCALDVVGEWSGKMLPNNYVDLSKDSSYIK